MSWKKHRLWVHIPDLSPSTCANMGRLLNFPCLGGNDNSTYKTELLRILNKLVHIKVLPSVHST